MTYEDTGPPSVSGAVALMVALHFAKVLFFIRHGISLKACVQRLRIASVPPVAGPIFAPVSSARVVQRVGMLRALMRFRESAVAF